ncbi:MAG: histidinol-phosphate transaminase [Candidatus Heteroscillospira sp.]|jgi:histidinol-phosphate aminotransferase
MSRFLDERFAALEAYTPGEQPLDKKYIKLNTNESPYPPAPGVIAALNSREVADLRLYSDPATRALTAAIAEHFGVSREMVYTGNGSDDILNFTFMAFCGKNKGAAFPDISYGFYEVYGQLYGLDCLRVPLREDFSIDPADYFGLGRTIVIANPNAPTGMALSRSQIVEILEHNPDDVVLIDEAYVDFGAESCVELTKSYKNLIVAQTFSKSRSLAGARLGFAIGDGELIADLNKIKFSTNPYCINRLTALAGVEAIRDTGYFEENCKKIIATREKTAAALAALGFETLPSSANFLFTRRPGVSGEKLYDKLRERGILVRRFSKKRIEDWLRVTIGAPEEMEALASALGEIIKEEI